MIKRMWIWFKLITFMRYCYHVNPEFDAKTFLMYTCIHSQDKDEAYVAFLMATGEI